MAHGNTRGWIVTFAGLGINLALGVLYSWSVIAKVALKADRRGRLGLERRAGESALRDLRRRLRASRWCSPAARRTASARGWSRLVGGALCGIGMIVASFGTRSSTLPITVGFGVLTGVGIGLGYAAATPAAVKWFPPQRKGLITGIVVAGFGLASVYIAPLTKLLLQLYGVPGPSGSSASCSCSSRSGSRSCW